MTDTHRKDIRKEVQMKEWNIREDAWNTDGKR
jgi:hypothetical protein